MAVIAWIVEGAWPALRGRRPHPRPEGAEIVLLHVTGHEIPGIAHGAFAGLLGRGHPERDPGTRLEHLAAASAKQLLQAAADRLGRPGTRIERTGRVERRSWSPPRRARSCSSSPATATAAASAPKPGPGRPLRRRPRPLPGSYLARTGARTRRHPSAPAASASVRGRRRWARERKAPRHRSPPVGGIGLRLVTDVVAMLCHYGFRVRGLQRLQSETLSDNGATPRSAEHDGFVREGVLR